MYIHLTDYLGAIFSFISTILFTRSNVWAWPFCILTNLVNLYLFYHTGIYADAVLEFFYITMAIYGIWHWLYGGDNNQQLKINNLPINEAIILLFLLVIGYQIAAYILATHTDSSIVKLDALAMVLSLLGQWLTSRKYIETWVIWFIADFILAAMFYYKSLPAHLVLNLIYLPITVYGYYSWNKLRYQAVHQSSS